MKVVLKNSNIVYEQLTMTKVSKTDTTFMNKTLCTWASVADKSNFKVIIKITGYDTIVNPIPTTYVAYGAGDGTEPVIGYFTTVLDSDGNTGSTITLEGTLPSTAVADTYIKVGYFSPVVKEIIALRKYTFDVEYVFY